MNEAAKRFKLILKTSVIGIVVNVILALSKVIIGMISNSIAIMSDGVNNFADATSSLITIIGAALAGKAPDRKHPFGYGRLEYLSSLTISVIVLYAGITSLIEAIKAIIHPEEPDYSPVVLIIVGIAVIIKLTLSFYTQAMGKKAHSDSLVASGKEAILDSVVSIATLLAASIYLTFGFGIESYLAAVISIIIIKTGIELLKETISKILGEPGDIELIRTILSTIKGIDGVNSAHDLVLFDYGPDVYLGSVHIAVDDRLNAAELDALTRKVTEAVSTKTGIYLASVGIYSNNTMDEAIISFREEIRQLASSFAAVKGFHGFYLDKESKKISFDLVITLDVKDRRVAFDEVANTIREKYPDYTFSIGMDMDVNEV